MDRAKGLVKGGWNPKGKDGGRESWRGDFKGVSTVVSDPYHVYNIPTDND
jgi:hypothetical protein